MSVVWLDCSMWGSSSSPSPSCAGWIDGTWNGGLGKEREKKTQKRHIYYNAVGPVGQNPVKDLYYSALCSYCLCVCVCVEGGVLCEWVDESTYSLNIHTCNNVREVKVGVRCCFTPGILS